MDSFHGKERQVLATFMSSCSITSIIICKYKDIRICIYALFLSFIHYIHSYPEYSVQWHAQLKTNNNTSMLEWKVAMTSHPEWVTREQGWGTWHSFWHDHSTPTPPPHTDHSEDGTLPTSFQKGCGQRFHFPPLSHTVFQMWNVRFPKHTIYWMIKSAKLL